MKEALLLGAAAGVAAAMIFGGRDQEGDVVGTMTYWSSATMPPVWPSIGPARLGPMWLPPLLPGPYGWWRLRRPFFPRRWARPWPRPWRWYR